MFVTTAGRTNEQMIEKAMGIARELGVNYIPRSKKSIQYMQTAEDSDCIVAGKQRLELFHKGEIQPFFFHPNSAIFRIKRLMNGEHDPFVNAAQLSKGKSLLDCTLGLASDSIVASWVVGESGQVTGIEGQRFLAYMVQEGLQSWDSGLSAMDAAMKRIRLINERSFDYLLRLPNNSVDCVYFDPMFEEGILESDGIQALSHFAIHDKMQEETIREAVRVARERVILKDHYKSTLFEKFGFHVVRRKTAKFHFGWIEK